MKSFTIDLGEIDFFAMIEHSAPNHGFGDASTDTIMTAIATGFVRNRESSIVDLKLVKCSVGAGLDDILSSKHCKGSP